MCWWSQKVNIRRTAGVSFVQINIVNTDLSFQDQMNLQRRKVSLPFRKQLSQKLGQTFLQRNNGRKYQRK